MCCLQETCLIHEETYRLKLKGEKMILKAIAILTDLISNKNWSEQADHCSSDWSGTHFVVCSLHTGRGKKSPRRYYNWKYICIYHIHVHILSIVSAYSISQRKTAWYLKIDNHRGGHEYPTLTVQPDKKSTQQYQWETTPQKNTS